MRRRIAAEADALQPESLDNVLEGVSTAYYLVHSMAAGKSFPELDVEAAKHDTIAVPKSNAPELDEGRRVVRGSRTVWSRQLASLR